MTTTTQITEAERIAKLEAQVERLEVALVRIYGRWDASKTMAEIRYELYRDCLLDEETPLAQRLQRKMGETDA